MVRDLLVISAFFVTIWFTTDCKEKTIKINKDISFKSHLNISYGSDAEQKMDLYVPDKYHETKKDVFIIIHGGGWYGGDKSMLTPLTLSLMKKFPNHIFANINYRLATNSRYALPNQTDDINKTILFLKKKLTYEPEFILLGNSAGGHLSMLYAYQSERNKKVKAVINIVGPSNLSDPGFRHYRDYSFIEEHLVDPKIIPDNISMNVFASPVYWITPSSPPSLSFYGTYDTIIPLSQKKLLDSALHKNNVDYQSFEFEGDHLNWHSDKKLSAFIVDKITVFLKRKDKK
ncbi:acetyl esterase/lipase [Chryseobacterium defluvii]|uniref:Acetyl esterase/lipase n=1 Tax=Chryseobacterium defluvii TaxID=160396 RepID=A0A840KEP7_9FLAO|nr:alpha/beta hydrolase [Chryseobacterium defluvii]MBB4806478.1 acetyl esterase/lipase [Chryseobacterium defluvii]